MWWNNTLYQQKYSIQYFKNINLDVEHADNLWIEITKYHVNYIVTIIYRHPVNVKQKILDFTNKLENCINQLINNETIILMGDFNLNLLDLNENKNIRNFIEMINNNNIKIINTEITRPNNNKSKGTVIDHIYFRNKSKIAKFKKINYGTLQNSISDHYPLYLEIEAVKITTEVKVRNDTKQIIHFNKKLFTKKIDEMLKQEQESPNNNDERESSFFYEQISNIYNTCQSTIEKKIKKDYQNKNWINSEIKNMIQFKIKLYRKMVKTKSFIDTHNYKIYKNKLNIIIKNTKANFFSNEILQNKNNNKRLWDIYKNIVGYENKQQSIKVIRKDNNLYTNDYEIAQQLNCYYNELGNNDDYLNKSNIVIAEANNKRTCFYETNEIEISTIINKIKSASSGFDNIRPTHIKDNLSILLKPIAHAINLDIKYSKYPKTMKIIKIVPIYKSGRKDDISNYRPLCITSFFTKIYDNVINNRLMKYLEENKILSMNQHAYRKNHSCITSLISMLDNIYTNLDNNKIVIAIFLDLSQAFPSINHNILLNKLKMINLTSGDIKLLENYLKNTEHVTKINNSLSDYKTFKNGVWQGSCLASTLFNIYINDITKIDQESIYIYADDITLLVDGNTVEEINSKAKQLVENIQRYCAENYLKINYNKCRYIPLNGRKKYNDNEINLKFEHNELEKVDNHKYLGIIIDKKLNWELHKNNIIKNLNKYIAIFYNIRDHTPTRVSIILFKTLVLSKVNYGIQLYGGSDLTKIQNKLDKILNIICNYKNKAFGNESISDIRKKYNILTAEQIYNIHWIKLSHNIIYNSYNLPEYFKKLIKIMQNRNGIIIQTNFRKSKFGDLMSKNVMQNKWNELNIQTRGIQDKNIFIAAYLNTVA
jgi:hypothetical protein